uniref:Formin like 3 n=1 Tax=Phasianus colchicus TaxID=9054 RepID=A0A669QR87_PHACC
MGNVESADGEALPRGPGTGAAPGSGGGLSAGKMPMPEPCELEERFAMVLSSMNLPPDKARLLRQYDNEKKWDLICDQERFQVKSPPHAYIQKLQSCYFRGPVFGGGAIGVPPPLSSVSPYRWVREFLNDENRGLDVLVNYLSFTQCAVMFDFEGPDGGEDGALEKLRSWSRSIEDLQPPGAPPAPFGSAWTRSARLGALRAGTLPSRRALKNARMVSSKDDVHLCVMCLRAVMNYQYGFNLVMSHPHAVNEIALSLNNKNPRWGGGGTWGWDWGCEVGGVGPSDRNGTPRWGHGTPRWGRCHFCCPIAGKCPPAAPPLPGASPSIALTVGLSGRWGGSGGGQGVWIWGQRGDGGCGGGGMWGWGWCGQSVMERGGVPRLCPPPTPTPHTGGGLRHGPPPAIRIKKPIKTKFRLPVFNWTALKPNQISGTVFSELDDERVLQLRWPQCPELSVAQRCPAAPRRRAGSHGGSAPRSFDLAALPVDFVECLMRFVPTEAEVKALRQYERERRALDELSAEDRFMLHFSKVERLPQRMAVMAFLGNFADNLQMLTPQLNAIIAASASVKSSQKLKQMLEVPTFPPLSPPPAPKLLDTKSTDRKLTLLHFIALTVREKFPELATFWQELHFVEKAAAVSLENVLLDVKELTRGMELLRRECSLHESSVLRSFLAGSEGKLERLQKDARTAEDAYNAVVRYFGESPKTTPPSVFFPVFARFIRSYKDAEQENETRKKQEEVMREKLLAQEAKKQEKRNKWQQQELIAELRRRQAKEHRPVYEGKDGTIEDIITALKSVPFTARTAKRGSRFFCEPTHHEESGS